MVIRRRMNSLSGHLLTVRDVATIYRLKPHRLRALVRQSRFRVPPAIYDPFLLWSRADVVWDVQHASYKRDWDTLARQEHEKRWDKRYEERQSRRGVYES
jgi:hypothetical protein